jgi:hypothetical protein
MPLWGTAHASATNKPKHLTTDEDSPFNKQDVYATQMGWVQKAGTAASGNDNASALPEVLVAIGGLAGADASTGLRTPTCTAMSFIVGATATTDLTAVASGGEMTVEITYDEAVTIAGSPQLVIANGNQSSAGQGNYTLTYTGTGSTANQIRFKATSLAFSVTDVLTIGGANITLNSGTISDTVVGGTTLAASLVLSGLTAVTHTVLA